MALPTAVYEVKGAAFRAYIAQVVKMELLDAVKERVAPETRAAIDSPPLPGVWMDANVVEDLVGAIEALRGMEAVRVITRAGQKDGVLRFLMPVVTGVLRLFGAKPDTLLSRFADLTKSFIRGTTFEWKMVSPRAGTLTVVFPRKHVPRHVFVGMESGCWLTLELCGVKGTVADVDIVREGTTGVIRVAW
jgi:hypothetical protein